ncbi:hypothetical protein AA309_06795 [Microvirga vignae]|uniref:DUF3072 domain-containing protein n=1 Tax=Microvirga vignae TaxID=1225564 RepID=A0A0H1RF48_9HYPH|nr:DUF3072 domain-containing protein [Microvirga vignae]KLK93734.1 hypothetical protein AA309_06795 [Microvirga vignae]
MTPKNSTSHHGAHERKHATEPDNPKVNPAASDNRVKDPEDWVTGHEPMTGAQASYLKTLSEQAHDPKAFDPDLDKAEASKRIDQLKKGKGH